MRPQLNLRDPRTCAATVAIGLTCTVALEAPLAADAGPPQPPASLPATLTDHHVLRLGDHVTVSGRIPQGQGGGMVELDFRAAGTAVWNPVASATSDRSGGFALRAPLTRSGSVRVATGGAASSRTPVGSGRSAVSAELPVSVQGGLTVRPPRMDVLIGGALNVTGILNPTVPHRAVVLQERAQRGWQTVARARTGPHGRYRLSFHPRHTGSESARVRFAGDVQNAAAVRPIGRVNVYRLAGASWYGGGGSLACGGTLSDATQGVANKTLPCGTLVTLRYGARRVRVPVVDRGPYVAGRDFDLTPATRAALGFGDTGEVWSTR